jgi:hypothetical protein
MDWGDPPQAKFGGGGGWGGVGASRVHAREFAVSIVMALFLVSTAFLFSQASAFFL